MDTLHQQCTLYMFVDFRLKKILGDMGYWSFHRYLDIAIQLDILYKCLILQMHIVQPYMHSVY